MSKFIRNATITLTFALIATASVSFMQKDEAPSNFDVQAAATQTHRRVYVVLIDEGEQKWTGSQMFIHYWGGSSGTTWASCPEMIKVVSDYWQGIFYYDIPVDTTNFMVKAVTGDTSKVSDKSDNFAVSSLFIGSDYKAGYVSDWVNDAWQRTISYGDNLPSNSGQIAAVLNHIDSCSDSYAGGFNAWPQINDLFISPSTYEGTTVVTDNFGLNTTISDKIAYLSNRYTIDQNS